MTLRPRSVMAKMNPGFGRGFSLCITRGHMRTMIAAAALLLAAPAAAQDDPMEMQRCIWSCLADSKGADDPAYHQCIARNCHEGAAAAPATPSAQKGVWIYGEHPVLGLSAHVVVDGGAYGIACFPPTPGVGYTTMVRATDGLIPNVGEAVGPAYVVEGPFGLGGNIRLEPTQRGFAELRTDACMVDFDRLKAARELKFLDIDSLSLRADGNSTVMTVGQEGRSYDIRTSGDVAALSGTVVIPLRGSSKALGKLLRSCPAMAAELAEGCGDY